MKQKNITRINKKDVVPLLRSQQVVDILKIARTISTENSKPSLVKNRRSHEVGMTLLELIIACFILLILSAAALPLVRVTVIRQRERELREDLRDMRNAIDHYKDMADRNLLRVEVGSEGYPPDLDTLVKGASIGGSGAAGHNVRFLRRVPVDPMTGRKEWGMRSVQDDSDSTSWGGKNVFDVYSKSAGTALDGTKYSNW